MTGCSLVSENEMKRLEGKCFFAYEDEFRGTFGKYFEPQGYPDMLRRLVYVCLRRTYQPGEKRAGSNVLPKEKAHIPSVQ
jgi:hypothetical protein